MPLFTPRPLIAVLLTAAALVASCSNDDDARDGSAAGTSATIATDATSTTARSASAVSTTTPFASPAASATVTGPITTGNGVVLGPPGIDLRAVGYTETEWFLSGTAQSYASDAPLTSDGRWTVRPGPTAPFTTRIVVRRPADSARFNGSVVVEWLNVTGGLDAAPDWVYAHVELIRRGYAWVGVSAQRVGVEGGGLPLGAALVLKTADPVRYGTLSHPGDSFSYDLFSQAGAVVRREAARVLDGLSPALVWAIGESQSATRLTTYVNAVAPTAKVFDGYVLHSRFAGGAPLASDPLPAIAPPPVVQVRSDLAVPVMVVSSETDVIGERGYRRTAQPDTTTFRSWEVAGTAHADGYNLGIGDTDDGTGAADRALFEAMRSPSASVYAGLLTCTRPINNGPHTYVLRAAVAAFDRWLRTGQLPPSMPPLEMDGLEIIRDPNGIARGGIRTPHVDAPIAVLSGSGQTGSAFCGLFGTTQPLDATALAARYPDRAAFLSQWRAASARSVSAGALLPEDAERLTAAAEASDLLR